MADVGLTPSAGELPTFPAGTKLEDIVGALQGLGQAAQQAPILGQMIKGFTAAHDANNSTPEHPYTTDQAMQGASNMMTLMGGGAPAAETGAAGIFGGRLAKTADLNALSKAKTLESSGEFRDIVNGETGWHKGADSEWRFEIPDYKAELGGLAKTTPSNATPNWQTVPSKIEDFGSIGLPEAKGKYLGSILHHPDLFQAYPDLTKMPVFPMPQDMVQKGYQGLYSKTDQGVPAIWMARNTPEDFKGTLLHEIQHGIQKKEGFAEGGNPNTFTPQGFPELEDTLHQRLQNADAYISKQLGYNPTYFRSRFVQYMNGDNRPLQDAQFMNVLNELHSNGLLKKYKDYMDAVGIAKPIRDVGYDQYHRLAGEVESRNVSGRANMNPTALNELPPWYTEDVPRSQQIVYYHPNDAVQGMVNLLSQPK